MSSKKDKIVVVKSAAVNYQQLVSDAAVLVQKFHQEALEFYYRLGKKVHTLCQRPDKYGNKTVETFSADLEKKKVKLGKDALYDARQLFENISADQLKLAKAAKLSLRRLLLLCRKSVDKDVRQNILEAAYAARDNDETFDIKASLEKQGAGVGSQSTPTVKTQNTDQYFSRAVKILKSAYTLISNLENKLTEVGESVEIVCAGDSEDKMRAAKENFGEANLNMESLMQTWETQQAKATKAFKKVSSILDPKSKK